MNTQEEYKNELPAVAPGYQTSRVVERTITVNGAKINVKSVFNNKTSLEHALNNIVARKLSQTSGNV